MDSAMRLWDTLTGDKMDWYSFCLGVVATCLFMVVMIAAIDYGGKLCDWYRDRLETKRRERQEAQDRLNAEARAETLRRKLELIDRTAPISIPSLPRQSMSSPLSSPGLPAVKSSTSSSTPSTKKTPVPTTGRHRAQ